MGTKQAFNLTLLATFSPTLQRGDNVREMQPFSREM
jgi:hypothetical protein